jgi:hypothetical protein
LTKEPLTKNFETIAAKAAAEYSNSIIKPWIKIRHLLSYYRLKQVDSMAQPYSDLLLLKL